MRRRCQYLGSSRPATHSVQSRPSSASTWWPVLAECYRKDPASHSKYLDSRTSQGMTCMGTSTRRTRPMKAHRPPREHLQEFRVHTSESSAASPHDAIWPVARSRRAESKFALATWQSAKIYASAPVMTYRLCIKSILITRKCAPQVRLSMCSEYSHQALLATVATSTGSPGDRFALAGNASAQDSSGAPPPPKKPRVEAVPATLADTPQPRACKHVTDHVWDPVREYQLRKPSATRPNGGYRIAKDFECHT